MSVISFCFSWACPTARFSSPDEKLLSAPSGNFPEGALSSFSWDEFLAAVWETRGVVVSQNTFYQNISLLRKS
ncbi:hypothetical protein ACI3TF_29155, partial [Klebsiella pneumoniae]